MKAKKIFLALIIAVIMATGAGAQLSVRNFDQQLAAAKDLTGSWIGDVYPAPGSPFGQFKLLQTFMSDGTMISDDTLQYVPPPGTPQHGVWQKNSDGTFSATFLILLTDNAAHFKGSAKVRSTLTLNPSGDEFISQDTNDSFDRGGNLVSSFQSTTQARRIKVEAR